MTPFMSVAIVLFIAALTVFTVVAFTDRSYDIACILLLVLIISAVGLGFYLNYGLTVSKRYVTVLYFQELRIFKYSDVTRIELWIDDDTVVGTVKAVGEKAYDFVFADFDLVIGFTLFPRLWDVKVKISERKAAKIVAAASYDSKITIHNRLNNIKGR